MDMACEEVIGWLGTMCESWDLSLILEGPIIELFICMVERDYSIEAMSAGPPPVIKVV